jgi:hypothetical protein
MQTARIGGWMLKALPEEEFQVLVVKNPLSN